MCQKSVLNIFNNKSNSNNNKNKNNQTHERKTVVIRKGRTQTANGL